MIIKRIGNNAVIETIKPPYIGMQVMGETITAITSFAFDSFVYCSVVVFGK